jgi:hypothetical protein
MFSSHSRIKEFCTELWTHWWLRGECQMNTKPEQASELARSNI